jgi:hypothetical protein
VALRRSRRELALATAFEKTSLKLSQRLVGAAVQQGAAYLLLSDLPHRSMNSGPTPGCGGSVNRHRADGLTLDTQLLLLRYRVLDRHRDHAACRVTPATSPTCAQDPPSAWRCWLVTGTTTMSRGLTALLRHRGERPGRCSKHHGSLSGMEPASRDRLKRRDSRHCPRSSRTPQLRFVKRCCRAFLRSWPATASMRLAWTGVRRRRHPEPAGVGRSS